MFVKACAVAKIDNPFLWCYHMDGGNVGRSGISG